MLVLPQMLSAQQVEPTADQRLCSHMWRCRDLDIVEAPLFDLEVRGVPALQYFGSRVWNMVPQDKH